VAPRKREPVLARDGHCCTEPGCRQNAGLDLHQELWTDASQAIDE
jgi:hypothetical protein